MRQKTDHHGLGGKGTHKVGRVHLGGEGGLIIILYSQIEFVVILKHNHFARNDAAEANWHIQFQV